MSERRRSSSVRSLSRPVAREEEKHMIPVEGSTRTKEEELCTVVVNEKAPEPRESVLFRLKR